MPPSIILTTLAPAKILSRGLCEQIGFSQRPQIGVDLSRFHWLARLFYNCSRTTVNESQNRAMILVERHGSVGLTGLALG